MKRIFRFLLVALLAAASLTCFAYADYLNNNFTPDWTTVSQADTGASLTYTNGTYTASYTSTNLKEDGQYALIVVRCDSEGNYSSFSEVTIKYINQTVSDSGSISFDFIPMSTPDCVVLLSGEFNGGVQSPLFLGTLIKKGVDLSGTITRQGGTATVKLYDSTDTLLGQATTDTSGAYTITMVPEGIGYYLEVSKPGYLTYTYSGIEVTFESTTLPTVNITAFGGDINGDGWVLGSDFTILLSDFNKNSTTSTLNNSASDLNCDNWVLGSDFSILLASFNKSAANATNS
ncbi:MAG: carboxypeptidase regulatory-like domain-containing protein [Oscillospiraceae bacterium]